MGKAKVEDSNSVVACDFSKKLCEKGMNNTVIKHNSTCKVYIGFTILAFDQDETPILASLHNLRHHFHNLQLTEGTLH